jgi:hypothetical protein
MHLFSSCYDMLREIKDMGGEDHGTIRAAVLEQMADAHLSRVDDFTLAGIICTYIHKCVHMYIVVGP